MHSNSFPSTFVAIGTSSRNTAYVHVCDGILAMRLVRLLSPKLNPIVLLQRDMATLITDSCDAQRVTPRACLMA